MALIPQTGLIGSEQALRQGLQGALGVIGRGAEVAGAELAPFSTGGLQAFNRQAALSGALGPEAQAEAIAGFTESPAQQFLREQGERAVLRGASATGGLGGGEVQKALQRHGIGLAAQEFDKAFGRLGALSEIGAGAAGQRAGIAERAGVTGGEAILGTGRELAGGRTRAGEQIAGAVGTTSSALADLVSRGGAGVADILSERTGTLANLLAQAGREGAMSQEELATLLANISTGSAAQRAALPSLPGLQPKRGILADIGRAAEGVGTAAAAFSDVKLKENIKKLGTTDKGINIYRWNWNAIGEMLTGAKSAVGVLAHEIQELMPEAVSTKDGYLAVNYGKVFNNG